MIRYISFLLLFTFIGTSCLRSPPPRKRKVAITYSGGGCRSFAASVGYTRGLEKIQPQFQDRVNLITAVSGGAWFMAHYGYNPNYQLNDVTAFDPCVAPNAQAAGQTQASLVGAATKVYLATGDLQSDTWEQFLSQSVLKDVATIKMQDSLLSANLVMGAAAFVDYAPVLGTQCNVVASLIRPVIPAPSIYRLEFSSRNGAMLPSLTIDNQCTKVTQSCGDGRRLFITDVNVGHAASLSSADFASTLREGAAQPAPGGPYKSALLIPTMAIPATSCSQPNNTAQVLDAGDGGFVDVTGIVQAIGNGARRVIAFVNSSLPIDFSDGQVCPLDTSLMALFGQATPATWQQCAPDNLVKQDIQIFSAADYSKLKNQLSTRAAAQEAAFAYFPKLKVFGNAQIGIRDGWVELLVVYLNPVASYNSATTLPDGFPNVPTLGPNFIFKTADEQSQLADFTEWLVTNDQNLQNQLSSMLGHP